MRPVSLGNPDIVEYLLPLPYPEEKFMAERGKEQRSRRSYPDFTLPTELAIEIATEVMGEGEPLAARLEESKQGGFSNVWFDDSEQGEADRHTFRSALNRYDESTLDNDNYFLLSFEDGERAIKLFQEKFRDGDIQGYPASAGTIMGGKREIFFKYPLFAEKFREMLQEEGITFKENQTRIMRSDFDFIMGDKRS